MARALGLVSLLLAALDLVASYTIARALAFATVTLDPRREVDSAYRVRLGEQLGMVAAGLFWLAFVIFVFHYYGTAKTRRALLHRAAGVMIFQLAVIVAAYMLPLTLAAG